MRAKILAREAARQAASEAEQQAKGKGKGEAEQQAKGKSGKGKGAKDRPPQRRSAAAPHRDATAPART